MKQVTINIRNGQLSVPDYPAPAVQDGQVLIANRCSLVSAGTEKMICELSSKSLLQKAKERPDHVRRVIEKVRNEGLRETFNQVREKLDEPFGLGYSSAGVVLACGHGVQEFQPGDRVASNGPHAEVCSVPRNLVATIPRGVDFDQAAFGVVGSIALQGVRLSELRLGETAFVIGLGLVGQLAVGLLAAAGVRVIGTDLDSSKCLVAKKMGAENAESGLSASRVSSLTGGVGADAVLICASTDSDTPVELAGEAVRQKGRVVSVGAVGMNLPRRPYYFKEAEFVVSCSYGPGRYDTAYEDRGQDYPLAHVRWTEQRNIAAVLQLMASRKLDVTPLITHRFGIDTAETAYDLIERKGEYEKSSESYLGILLDYPEDRDTSARTIRLQGEEDRGEAGGGPKLDRVGLGCVGAGNFARNVLLPKALALPGIVPESICSAGGASAAHTGRKLGFRNATTDAQSVFDDERVDAVIIATRHDLHADQVVGALEAGKHVFVEKPLCLTANELAEIEAVVASSGPDGPQVMVGFNRRFAPATNATKKFFFGVRAPKTVSFRFNAGDIPADHWTQDEEVGGGRILGEACHAIDLCTHLVGSPPVRVHAESVGGPDAPAVRDDQCFITVRHADGSVSSVGYLAGGDKAMPKERIEIFGGGRVAVIDDFKLATGVAGGKSETLYKGPQDKGHSAELAAFFAAVQNGDALPIPWADTRAVTLASLQTVRSLREGWPQDVPFAEAPAFQVRIAA